MREVDPKSTSRALAFGLWGKYRKKWLRATLPVSFQFHHTQMNGIPAAEFLERLQQKIREI